MKPITLIALLGVRTACARDDGNSLVLDNETVTGFDARTAVAMQAIQDEQELVGVDKAAIDFEAAANKLVDEAITPASSAAASKTSPSAAAEQLDDAVAIPELAAPSLEVPPEAAAKAAAPSAKEVTKHQEVGDDSGGGPPLPMPASLRGTSVQSLVTEAATETAEQEKTRQAEVLIHSRLAKLSSEETTLRKNLADALRWGSELSDEMVTTQKKVAAERRNLQEALRAKDKEFSQKMSADEAREEHLEGRVKAVSQTLGDRSQKVVQLEKKLLLESTSSKQMEESMRRTAAELQRVKADATRAETKLVAELQATRQAETQAREELNSTKKSMLSALAKEGNAISASSEAQRQLRRQLAKEQALNQDLKQSLQNVSALAAVREQGLERADGKIKTLTDTLAAKNAYTIRLKQDQSSILKQEAVQESDVHWLRSVKAADEQELNNLRAKLKEERHSANTALTQEQLQVRQVQKLLAEKTASESALKDKLFMADQRVQQEHAQAEMNKASAQQQLDKLTAELQEERKHEEELLKERSAYYGAADAADAYKVPASADARRKTRAEVAKAMTAGNQQQFSKLVVPPHVQERLSQAAEEQAAQQKALRAQAQAEAKKQIENLEQQFSSLLKNKLNKVVTTAKPATAEADDDDDDTSASEDTAAVAKAIKEATSDVVSATEGQDVEQQPGSTSLAPRGGSLAKDSQGLKSMLPSSTTASPAASDDDDDW